MQLTATRAADINSMRTPDKYACSVIEKSHKRSDLSFAQRNFAVVAHRA
jgi:hypothetical protein